jgi:hypothetical protein
VVDATIVDVVAMLGTAVVAASRSVVRIAAHVDLTRPG